MYEAAQPIQRQINLTQQHSFFHSARISFLFFFFLIFDFECLCTVTTIDYCVAHDSDNTLMSPAWQPQASDQNSSWVFEVLASTPFNAPGGCVKTEWQASISVEKTDKYVQR